jgi:hypothetical protein
MALTVVINSQAASMLSCCKEETQRFGHAIFKGVEFTDRHLKRSHGNKETATVVAPGR